MTHTRTIRHVAVLRTVAQSTTAHALQPGRVSNYPVAKSDKFPPTPSKVFLKLALVKKESASREEADKFTRLTLRGDIDQILQAKEPIELDDILKADDKVHLVVVEGAPGIGKSTLAWELCRQWPTLESLNRFSLVVLLRLREEEVQSATDISHLFPCGDDPGLMYVYKFLTNIKQILYIYYTTTHSSTLSSPPHPPINLSLSCLVTD